jgi:hypothetical protein
LRHAKITPAALHRRGFENRCVGKVEAVGRGPEFQPVDFSRVVAGVPLRVAKPPGLAAS